MFYALALRAPVLIVAGVQGVIHLATDTSFSPKYDVVISTVKAMTTTFLDATAKAPNVKSVVMTSSRIAVFVPIFGEDINATVNDWADDLVDRAQTIKQDDPSAPVIICKASQEVR
jgi:nucleoside-diphosphate-sugar epimerase